MTPRGFKLIKPKDLVISKHKIVLDKYVKLPKTTRVKEVDRKRKRVDRDRIKLSSKLSSILNSARSLSKITMKDTDEIGETNITVIEKDCDNDYSLLFNSLRLNLNKPLSKLYCFSP